METPIDAGPLSPHDYVVLRGYLLDNHAIVADDAAVERLVEGGLLRRCKTGWTVTAEGYRRYKTIKNAEPTTLLHPSP